jgi:hypothetical protein
VYRFRLRRLPSIPVSPRASSHNSSNKESNEALAFVAEIIALLTAFGWPFQQFFLNDAGGAVNATASNARDVLGKKSAMPQQRSADKSLIVAAGISGEILWRLLTPTTLASSSSSTNFMVHLVKELKK